MRGPDRGAARRWSVAGFGSKGHLPAPGLVGMIGAGDCPIEPSEGAPLAGRTPVGGALLRLEVPLRRDILRFLPRPGRWLNRSLLGVIAGIGMTGTTTPSLAAEPASEPTPAPSTTIVNRSKKVAKLVLRLPSTSSALVAQHGSHSSHKSHVSGSGGSTPAPRPAPVEGAGPPAAAAGLLAPPPVAEVHYFDGDVESLDPVARTFVVKDRGTSKTYVFSYRDDTTFVGAATGAATRFDDYADIHSGHVPVAPKDHVRVTWKMGADAAKVIATSLAALP